MSRSYRKNAIVTEQQRSGKGAKLAKRQANRAVRAEDEVADYRAYRKHSCSWNISDYKFRVTDPTWKDKRK